MIILPPSSAVVLMISDIQPEMSGDVFPRTHDALMSKEGVCELVDLALANVRRPERFKT